MSTVRPFVGSVVSPDWADRVVAPMHDTLRPEERERILATNPYSYLHVTRAPDEHDDPDEVVEGNRLALRRLLESGAFAEPGGTPALYAYRLEADGHRQTGIVAEVAIEDFAEGRVLGHEAVAPERVAALVRHMTTVATRSDLVALMYERDPEVQGVVKRCCDGPPILATTAGDLTQTVWRMEDPEDIAIVGSRFDQHTLYITDGHHRVAASIELWDQDRGTGGGVLCVLFPDDELRVLAFHRRILGPVDPGATLERLGETATVEPIDDPAGATGVCLYLDRRWYRVEPLGRTPSGGRDGLDVTWLHGRVLEPLFGLRTPDDERLEVASELIPTAELTRRCDEDGGALFLLPPPDLHQLMEVADRGEVVPPKATYFDPKPLSGVFLRPPDG